VDNLVKKFLVQHLLASCVDAVDVKNTTVFIVFTASNRPNDLTSSQLDCFKCIQLFKCETRVPVWACIFHDRSNDRFIIVHKIRLRYISLFELLEKSQTLRCLGCYCSNVVSPSERVANSYSK